jgi:hypothetical protein
MWTMDDTRGVFPEDEANDSLSDDEREVGWDSDDDYEWAG